MRTGVELGPLIIANIIVLVGIGVGLGFGVRAVNRRVRRADAEPAAAPLPQDPYRMGMPAVQSSPTELAPLYYILSILFWPVGIGLGAYFLKDAKTTRMGRVCIFIGMATIGAVTLLTCAGTVLGAVVFTRSRPTTVTTPVPRTYPTYTPPQPTAPAFSRTTMNTPATLGDLQVTFVSMDRAFTPPTRYSPQTQGPVTYVAFDVTMKNRGDRIESVGTHQLQLFDSEGHAFRPYYSGKTPALTSVQLTPDNLVRGWVTFELPAGSKPQRLQVNGTGRSSQQVVEMMIEP